MSQSLYGLETEYRQAFRHTHNGKRRRVRVATYTLREIGICGKRSQG